MVTSELGFRDTGTAMPASHAPSATPRCRHRTVGWRGVTTAQVLLLGLLCAALGAGRGVAQKCPKLVLSAGLQHGQLPQSQCYALCNAGDDDRSLIAFNVSQKRIGQVWKGWGTTLGDFATFVGSQDSVTRDCIGDLLFSRQALGLNLVRYHIPGGYNARYSRGLARDRYRGTGYWPLSQGRVRFDPNGDRNQVAFLKVAKQKGVPYVEAIAYSPPWWMTYTNDSTGAVRKYRTNLKPEFRRPFAKYIARVVRYLRTEVGVNVQAVVPTNEPLEGWWTRQDFQKSKKHFTEGCNYNADELNQLYPLVRRELDPDVQLVGVDSWVGTMMQVLWKPGAPRQLSKALVNMVPRLNVHGYRLKNSMNPANDFRQMDSVRKMAKRLKKPLWQTEWGPLGVAKGTDMQVATLLARKIMQHVNILGVEAWFHWQAIHPLNNFWGMIRTKWDMSIKEVSISKQFFAFLHFSRFLRPGATPMFVASKCLHTVMAVYDGRYPRLTITVVNQRAAPHVIRAILRGYTCRGACTYVHMRTTSSPTENFATVATGKLTAGTLTLGPATIAGESVNTFIISNIIRPP